MCFVDCSAMYNLANKSNRMHNSVQYIYFSSVHVSGIHVPIIRRKLLCIYATLVFVTLYGWRLAGWLYFNPTSRPNATDTA